MVQLDLMRMGLNDGCWIWHKVLKENANKKEEEDEDENENEERVRFIPKPYLLDFTLNTCRCGTDTCW